MSTKAIQKLGVKTEAHPNPDKLLWLKKSGEVAVSECALISFSIGSKYQNQACCDMVVMDACHLLLGRRWQYDRRVTHDGHVNTYSFFFNNTKMVLLPSRDVDKPKPTRDSTNLISHEI